MTTQKSKQPVVKWTPERHQKFSATMKAKKLALAKDKMLPNDTRIATALHGLYMALGCWPEEKKSRLPISKAKALVVLAISTLEGK